MQNIYETIEQVGDVMVAICIIFWALFILYDLIVKGKAFLSALYSPIALFLLGFNLYDIWEIVLR